MEPQGPRNRAEKRQMIKDGVLRPVGGKKDRKAGPAGDQTTVTQRKSGKPANRQEKRAEERREAKRQQLEKAVVRDAQGNIIEDPKLDDIFGQAEDVSQLLGMLAGAASLAWDENPTGVFDSEYATALTMSAEKVLVALMQNIVANEVQTALMGLREKVIEKLAEDENRDESGHVMTPLEYPEGTFDKRKGKSE